MLLPPLQPFHHQHNNDEQVRRPQFMKGEESVARPQSAELKHSLKALPSHPNALCPENNPPNDRQEERQQHLPCFLQGREDASFGHLVGVLAVLARQYQRQEQQCVVRSPGDERPVGAVPETAQEEDDKSVSYDFRLRNAAAAQRNIDIIAEPSRQRDVPPAPKLRNIAAEIRHVEVPHQLYSE